jgi:hypothetical protein
VLGHAQLQAHGGGLAGLRGALLGDELGLDVLGLHHRGGERGPAASASERRQAVHVMAPMLWVKSCHIVFVVAWFAGLFYLPRLFVYHAQAEDPSRERSR